MKIYNSINNTANQKEILVSFEMSSKYILIHIDTEKETLSAKKLANFNLLDSDWQLTEEYPYPSAILSELLD